MMPSSPPLRLHNIQALRAVAAMIVVATHLVTMEIKHGGDHFLPPLARLGISGVDVFFVISGFIMVYVTWNSGHKIRDALSFLFGRLTRIYPLYWLLATAVFIMWSLKPGLISFEPEKTSLIKSFLLWPQDTFPMLKVAWTLIHELYFYLFFAVLLLVPAQWRMAAIGVWAGLVLLGNQMRWNTLNPEFGIIFHPLTFEFFLGAFTAWIFCRFGGRAGLTFTLIGVTAFIATTAWIAVQHAPTSPLSNPAEVIEFFKDPKAYPSNWVRVWLWGVPAALTVYGLASLDSAQRTLFKPLTIAGDWSYSLYLSHVLVLSVIGYVWRRFAGEGLWDNVFMLGVMIAGCMIASACLWYLFEKPCLKLFKRLRLRLFPPASGKNNPR